MNILISGGTGFIGKKLGESLVQKNHKIFILTNKKSQRALPFVATIVNWKELEASVASGKIQIDAVINLAGENIAQRWSKDVKKKILESRTKTTSKLVSIFKDSNLKVFFSTSAVGYYGDRADETLTEDSGSGEGFLTEVCKEWENEALKIRDHSRVVIYRFGMVLGEGGALSKMIPPFKYGLGGMLGDGKMWVSWIHIDDLTAMISLALEKNLNGIYNAVSPNPVQNKEFSEELAKRFNKKLFLPVPAIALKLLLGEMSEVVLSSQRAIPKHILNEGFSFKYPLIQEALASVV